VSHVTCGFRALLFSTLFSDCVDVKSFFCYRSLSSTHFHLKEESLKIVEGFVSHPGDQ